MSGTTDFSWMRVALRSLFVDHTREDALAAIRDAGELSHLRDAVQSTLTDGRFGTIPLGDVGDNLLQALLALRVKFSESEAFEKLEVNLAMRERRVPGSRS